MALKDVVICSEDFPPYPGGIAQWAFGVAHSLQQMGHRVQVFTRDRGEQYRLPTQTLPCAVNFVQGRYWRQWRSFYWYRALRDYLVPGRRIDVVIATTWNAARGLLPLARRHHVPLVTIVHGLEVTRTMPALKRRWLTKTLNACDLVVAVSEFTRERVVAVHDLAPEKIVVLPDGVDPARFFPAADTAALRRRFGLQNEKVILTLARVIERKGHDQVLKALPAVKRSVPAVKYLICGPWEDDYYRFLQELVAGLGLQNDVVFTGYVPADEMNLFYSLCDVYIMPSRELVNRGDTEGFGITFLEANACAKPVIGSRSGGVVDAVVDGETGFLVEPENTDEIARKLILLLTDAELARRLGAQGRERILRQYTWEVIAQSLVNTIWKT